MKQTAVEWLIEHLNLDETSPNYNELIINKAKQMEKFQMYLSRVPIAYEDKSWQGLMERHFEQWYNETFKSE